MGHSDGDLSGYVDRARSVIRETAPLSGANTDLRLALPFLQTLGWDVHGPEVVAEYAVDGVVVDYALTVEDDPAVLVATAPCDPGDPGDASADGGRPAGATDDPAGSGVDPGRDGEAPDGDREGGDPHGDHGDAGRDGSDHHGEEDLPAAVDRLETAMGTAGVDWGIATDGLRFVFLARDEERVRCDLPDLPDRSSVVRHYTRAGAHRRHEKRLRRRRRAAADLFEGRRRAATEAVATALVGAVETVETVEDGDDDSGGADGDLPPAVRSELAAAARTFVDRVARGLAEGRRPTEALGGDGGDGAGGTDDSTAGATREGTDAAGSGDDRSATAGSEGGERGGVDADDSRPAGSDGESTELEDHGDAVDEGSGGGESASTNGRAATDDGRSATAAEPADTTGTDGTGGTATGADGVGPAGDAGESEPERRDDRDGGGDGAGGDGDGGEPPATRPGDEGAPMSRSTAGDDQGHTVKFFDDTTSIGAVGHDTAAGAFVQAVQYLIAGHDVDSRLSIPWGPSGERAVLNHDPVHPDGTEMIEAAQAGDYYLCTTIDPEAMQEVVEELADTVDLRVLFQGEW